jgi:hypothetical protein
VVTARQADVEADVAAVLNALDAVVAGPL